MPAEVDGPTLRVVRDGRLSTAWFGCSDLRSIWTILNCGSFDATVQVTRRIWLPTIRSGRREWRREQHPRKCVREPVQPVGPGPAEEVPHHANRGLVRGKGGGTGHRRRQPTRRHLRRRPARVVRRSAPTARDRPIARCSTTKAYAPTRYDLGRQTPGGGSYAADDAVGADHDNPRGPTLCHATVRPRPAPRPV